jgi:hexosaminidase
MWVINSILLGMVVVGLCGNAYAGGGDVIPRPTNVTEMTGQFAINANTVICYEQPAGSTQASDTAKQLADLIGPATGFAIAPKADRPAGNFILLTQNSDRDESLGDEGYELKVAADSISIRANTGAGLLYGVQTLRQLLPVEIEKREKAADVAWNVPCVVVTDVPRYPWRGLMLDVSRHFADKGEVEHFLDLMALHKFNRFHWHLTDDQGWRIEIKKYPKLTEIGAWRDGIGFNLDPKRSTHYREDGKYGGFYTQDEIREVVAYAAKLHIEVIPEIEMPGHATAAMAAYPEMSVGKKATTVTTQAGVMHQIYDPSNEQTFVFIDDVLSEVVQLFPAKYIHIGGDEVPKGPWKNDPACQAMIKSLGLKNEEELQSYFVKKVEKIVESKDRKLIGWDEILEGGLAPGATVMSWRGIGGGIQAAQEGHDVIMTPTSNCYLDYGQTRAKNQPPTIGGYLPLKTVYSFEPTPKKLTADEAKHVLGGQGNIWTEYMPNMKQVELMAFPRACALAEVTWSPAQGKDYKDFLHRLDGLKKRLSILGVNYFEDPIGEVEPLANWTPAQMSETPVTLQWDASKLVSKPGTYHVDFEYTGGGCRLDISWVALQADGVEVARDTHDGRTGASDHKNHYELKVPEAKAGAKYTLLAQVRSDGGTDSNGTVTMYFLP